MRFIHFFYKIGKSNNREVPNLEIVRKHLLREGGLEKKELMELIVGATTIMSKYFQFCQLIQIYFCREGAERAAHEGASDYRGRYSRLILRPDPHVREGR